MPFNDWGRPELDSPELAGGGLQICNRWLADFCSTAPERFLGASFIAPFEVEAAVGDWWWTNIFYGKVRAIVGENAAWVYGLDVEKLLAIADQIGPSIEEITTPLETVPALDGPERQGYGYFTFRTTGPYS